MTLDAVVARNLRAALDEREMRHVDLAKRMQDHGQLWTANTTAQVLTLRRQLSLLELAALCSVLEMPLAELLSGSDLIELPDGGAPVPLATLVEMLLTGRATTLRKIVIYEPGPEELKAMRRLGLDNVGDLHAASQKLFDTPYISEVRDERAGDLSDLPAATAQRKRGHAMRSVLNELEEDLAKSRSRRKGKR